MKKDKLMELFKSFQLDEKTALTVRGGKSIGAGGTTTGTETGYTSYGGDGKSTGCDEDCESDSAS